VIIIGKELPHEFQFDSRDLVSVDPGNFPSRFDPHQRRNCRVDPRSGYVTTSER